MPFLIPIISGVASFFGGAYIGTVINEANEAPTTLITADELTSNTPPASNRSDVLLYGLLGLAAYLAYRKLK